MHDITGFLTIALQEVTQSRYPECNTDLEEEREEVKKQVEILVILPRAVSGDRLRVVIFSKLG